MAAVRLFSKFDLAVSCYLLGSCSVQKQHLSTLDNRVTMKIYSAEILESVINRLASETGQDFEFNPLTLLPYKAKAAEYHLVPMRKILEEQLKNTPLVYRSSKKKLVILQQASAPLTRTVSR